MEPDTKAELAALRAVHQVLLELMLSQSPRMKTAVVQGLGQILAQPDHSDESPARASFLDQLRQLHADLQGPSRTTPEGRRKWIHLVDQ